MTKKLDLLTPILLTAGIEAEKYTEREISELTDKDFSESLEGLDKIEIYNLGISEGKILFARKILNLNN